MFIELYQEAIDEIIKTNEHVIIKEIDGSNFPFIILYEYDRQKFFRYNVLTKILTRVEYGVIKFLKST